MEQNKERNNSVHRDMHDQVANPSNAEGSFSAPKTTQI